MAAEIADRTAGDDRIRRREARRQGNSVVGPEQICGRESGAAISGEEAIHRHENGSGNVRLHPATQRFATRRMPREHNRRKRQKCKEHRESLSAVHSVEEPGPQTRRYDSRGTEEGVEAAHDRGTHACVAKQRNDKRHVADLTDSE